MQNWDVRRIKKTDLVVDKPLNRIKNGGRRVRSEAKPLVLFKWVGMAAPILKLHAATKLIVAMWH